MVSFVVKNENIKWGLSLSSVWSILTIINTCTVINIYLFSCSFLPYHFLFACVTIFLLMSSFYWFYPCSALWWPAIDYYLDQFLSTGYFLDTFPLPGLIHGFVICMLRITILIFVWRIKWLYLSAIFTLAGFVNELLRVMCHHIYPHFEYFRLKYQLCFQYQEFHFHL